MQGSRIAAENRNRERLTGLKDNRLQIKPDKGQGCNVKTIDIGRILNSSGDAPI